MYSLLGAFYEGFILMGLIRRLLFSSLFLLCGA